MTLHSTLIPTADLCSVRIELCSIRDAWIDAVGRNRANKALVVMSGNPCRLDQGVIPFDERLPPNQGSEDTIKERYFTGDVTVSHLWYSTPYSARLLSSSSGKSFGKNVMPNIDEEFRHLTYSQVHDITIKGNGVVIDVREKSELDETGTIPGSHHIPLGEVENALLTPANQFEKIYNFKKPNPDDSLVFSCRSGRRSLVALEKALAHGFTNAKHYSGGWLDWEKNSPKPN